MSYYEKSNYVFTNHAIERAKERLNMKSYADYDVIRRCKEYIKNSDYSFEEKNTVYIKITGTQFYFFVKDNSLVVTVSKMSNKTFNNSY